MQTSLGKCIPSNIKSHFLISSIGTYQCYHANLHTNLISKLPQQYIMGSVRSAHHTTLGTDPESVAAHLLCLHALSIQGDHVTLHLKGSPHPPLFHRTSLHL